MLQYFTKAKGEFIMTEDKTLKIVVIITGILTVLLGFYTLVRPLMTFLSIGWIFGIFLLINGIELVILSLSKEKKDVVACILGVLEALAGIILLSSGIQRFITDVMAAYLVGAIVLIYGIFHIVAGVKICKFSKGKGILSIVCGVLSILISMIAITHPLLTMISTGYMIAFSILMQGINMVVLGLNFGKTER